MQRQPEEELMTGEEQARAYAEADFEEAHSNFIRLFRERFSSGNVRGNVLDVGCGPGDITIRFARAFEDCRIHGVDGSEAMLRLGRQRLLQAGAVQERIRLYRGTIPNVRLPRAAYGALISNSLLHHLREPGTLWDTVRRFAVPGAPVFVMDLRRPASLEEARHLVTAYSAGEPEILRRDFYNSLLAAFDLSEIKAQLHSAGLNGFSAEAVGDRHVIIWGRIMENG